MQATRVSKAAEYATVLNQLLDSYDRIGPQVSNYEARYRKIEEQIKAEQTRYDAGKHTTTFADGSVLVGDAGTGIARSGERWKSRG